MSIIIIELSLWANLKSTAMGRGDRKTKKGKRFIGSNGKSRPVSKAKKVFVATKEEEAK